MTERLRVGYSHKISQQLGNGDFDTASLSSEWEFDLPDGADIQGEYGKAYALLRTVVDGYLETMPMPEVEARPKFVNNTAVLPGETIQPKERPSLTSTITETAQDHGEISLEREYYFQNARVWEVKKGTAKTGNKWAIVRIGAKGQIPGTGYAYMKSFQPSIVSKLSALEEGNHVDVSGRFEPQRDNPERFDFIPSTIERVTDVRAS